MLTIKIAQTFSSESVLSGKKKEFQKGLFWFSTFLGAAARKFESQNKRF